jgi:charged multivesicular body protein 7
MLKRKPSHDFAAPHASSVFSDDPTPMTKKRSLFRPKHTKPPQWVPKSELDMSELLDFVLQHEDAFKK